MSPSTKELLEFCKKTLEYYNATPDEWDQLHLIESDIIIENARVIHLFSVCPICGCDLTQEPKKVELIERIF